MSSSYALQLLVAEFFCEVPVESIPEDILEKVIREIHFTSLDPGEIAEPLYKMRLLPRETMVELQSPHTTPGPRRNKILYTLLPRCGHQHRTLASFYFALISSSSTVGAHRELATQVRLCALKKCSSVLPGPIISPGSTSIERNKHVVSKMAQKLKDVPISAEVAQEFSSYLGVQQPRGNATLGAIVKMWMETTQTICSPESIVDALVCTKNLGRYASRLAYPWNPPEVASSLTDVGCDVLVIAEFMGYRQQELPVQQGPQGRFILLVPKFLDVWKIPDCGVKTLEILDSLKRQTGFITEECEENIPGYSPQVSTSSVSAPSIYSRLESHWQLSRSMSDEDKSEESILSLPMQLNLTFMKPSMSKRASIPRRSYDARETVQPIVRDYQGQTAKHCKANEKSTEESLPDTSVTLEKNKEEPIAKKNSCPACPAQTELRRVAQDPLFDMVVNPNPHAVEQVKKMLAERGEYPNIQNETNGSSLLHLAVGSGSMEMVELLIERGAYVNAISDDHTTPLMVACSRKKKQIVERLLLLAADPDVKNCSGEACLHLRETLESAEVVECLLEHNASVDLERDVSVCYHSFSKSSAK